jgi:antitoxin MazE
MMVTKIQKWGNSLALRIPKALAEEAGLEQGKPVDVRYVNGELRIRKRRRKRYDLDEMLASVPDDYDEGEWDTGPAVGSEVWW